MIKGRYDNPARIPFVVGHAPGLSLSRWGTLFNSPVAGYATATGPLGREAWRAGHRFRQTQIVAPLLAGFADAT